MSPDLSPGWIDAHNHLQDARLYPYREQILAAVHKAGIQCAVVNGTRESDWAEVAFLARQHPMVRPSFGLHPWYVGEASRSWKDLLVSFVNGMPSAIGEIGLDQWMEEPDEAKQEEAFLFQLELAAERNLPVTFHNLKAWGRMLHLVKTNRRPERGFLLHSYGGSVEMVREWVELGAYFSISGYFSHERKKKQLEVFREIPIERLLVETDAPDMLGALECAPMDLWDDTAKKLLNHPANLPAIYEFAARFRAMPLETFTSQVATNFKRLFG